MGPGVPRLDRDLVERVRQRIAIEGSAPRPELVAEALRREHHLLGTAAMLSLVDQLHVDAAGAGPLQELLEQPGVTDVLVNGTHGVHVDSGHGLVRQAVRFHEEKQVRRLAQRLATLAGRRLDDASPWVDGRLPDGTRLHAVLAPVASPGTLISLRVPPRRRPDLAQLRAWGAISEAMAQLLGSIIEERRSFIVTGGTGTGKTTVLAALLATVPPAERIVIVEDSAELRPDHPHAVSLEGRPANIEGSGAITMTNLVRQALRMRPDRLVVGEVRGAEVVDLLAALNTGHEGGCGTVHANSASDVPARLAALGAMAGVAQQTLWLQVAAALEFVIHLDRDRAGRRYVREVARFVFDDADRLRVVTELREEL